MIHLPDELASIFVSGGCGNTHDAGPGGSFHCEACETALVNGGHAPPGVAVDAAA